MTHYLTRSTISVKKYCEYIEDQLFLINPCMKMTLDFWVRDFR